MVFDLSGRSEYLSYFIVRYQLYFILFSPMMFLQPIHKVCDVFALTSSSFVLGSAYTIQSVIAENLQRSI